MEKSGRLRRVVCVLWGQEPQGLGQLQDKKEKGEEDD